MEFAIVTVLVWLVCGVAAGIVLSGKGRSGCGGFLLGLLLGPLGLVIALLLRADQSVLDAADLRTGKSRRCPSCAEVIRAEALKCRHCGADIPPMDPDEIELRQRAENVEKGFLAAVILALSAMIVGFLFS